MTPDLFLDLYLDGRFVGTVRPDPALFVAPPAGPPAPADGRCRLPSTSGPPRPLTPPAARPRA